MSTMTKSKNQRGRGRPTKFDTVIMSVVEAMAKKGWTDNEMATAFQVTQQTWDNWKKDHPDFFGSLKRWKAEADAAVERSLYERAIGYTTTETKFATHQGLITDSREYLKHYPPDTTACIFWLKNRQPKIWRDKQELGVSILDPAERIKRAQARLKKIRDS